MATDAVGCAERATSDILIGPDWSLNMELCDLIDRDPGQTKEVMKVLKKRLSSKNPKMQLLTLYVLETLSKNCGNVIFQSIVENDILPEIVGIVKTKPDWNVMDKALMLIDIWQEALGGLNGSYPQYYAAYNDLKCFGVQFPPREEDTVPFFTPAAPPLAHSNASSTHAATRSSLVSDASCPSAAEIRSAQLSADLLLEMLGALDLQNPEALEQEIIVELVSQCRSYQESITLLLNNTGDEKILHQGLAVNDRLQYVLRQHEDIAKVAGNVKTGKKQSATIPVIAADPHDNKSEEGFDPIKQRSFGQTVPVPQKESVNLYASSSRISPIPPPPPLSRISPILPPPPSSNRPVHQSSATIDYLSGDAYTVEESPNAIGAASDADPSDSSTISPSSMQASQRVSSLSQHVTDPVSLPLPGGNPKPVDDKPFYSSVSSGTSPCYSWEASFPSLFDPAPSKHGQGQQSLKQHSLFTGSSSDRISEASTSHDDLADRTRNLSLGSSKSDEKVNKEEALFEDLLDFAKLRSSTSSSNPSRFP